MKITAAKKSGDMKVYYSNMSLPTSIDRNSIFLAGPTPREKTVQSWRIDAMKILESLGYDGEVYIPERVTGWSGVDYMEQVGWEHGALNNVGVILFWVPRDIAGGMPAFTTNIEFGMYVTDLSKAVVYGRPEWAEKVRYLDYLYSDLRSGEEIHSTLEATLKSAVGMASKCT